MTVRSKVLPKGTTIHWLVVWIAIFLIFPWILGCIHHPNWRTPSFFREVGIQPPTRFSNELGSWILFREPRSTQGERKGNPRGTQGEPKGWPVVKAGGHCERPPWMHKKRGNSPCIYIYMIITITITTIIIHNGNIKNIGGFLKWGVPQVIIHFRLGFSTKKPSSYWEAMVAGWMIRDFFPRTGTLVTKQ